MVADSIDIEMYSTHNEGKSVVAERFMRTFHIYDFDIADIVHEYNTTIKKAY